MLAIIDNVQELEDHMAAVVVDRTRVIERAHYYYALAILDYILRKGDSHTFRDTIQDSYSGDDNHGEWNLLPMNVLFDAALDWLSKSKLIELIEDDFGPSVIKRGEDFSELWLDVIANPELPFSVYSKITDSRQWLMSALIKLEANVTELGLTESDFERADTDWSPIPLEKAEAEFREVLNALDETVEQVRGANGYAQAAPEERKFVMENLSLAAGTLRREDTTSLGFLRRHVSEPLGILTKRFGDAILGALARGAVETLKTWLASRGWYL